MPGVLIVEAMDRSALRELHRRARGEGRLLHGLDNVRFRHRVPVTGWSARSSWSSAEVAVRKQAGRFGRRIDRRGGRPHGFGGGQVRTRQATADIHATAIVDPTAIVKDDEIGPYAIGPDVTIGEGTHVYAHAVIERGTIGDRCQIHYGPDRGTGLRREGEETVPSIGDGTVIREYVTVSRGTRAREPKLGGCLLMAYVHVAHDCLIGDRVTSNAVNLADTPSRSTSRRSSGMTPVHQFVRIGAHSFVGGGSRVQKDIPPFVKAAGIPTALFGLNTVGLDRRGFAENVKTELKRPTGLFFNSKLNIGQACPGAGGGGAHPYPEIPATFIRASERGITV